MLVFWKNCSLLILLVVGLVFLGMVRSESSPGKSKLKPIPDKLVVLTFDDSVKSHATFVAPLLKKYGFGATFYITEGFDFSTNKNSYMTWEEIVQLHKDGFEIGNHTHDHKPVNKQEIGHLKTQLNMIDQRCEKFEIPKPITYAYPGNVFAIEALPVLERAGIKFARRGGMPEYPRDGGMGPAYEPVVDHPLLIPSTGNARPDWTLEDFKRAAEKAKDGKICVMQFHGVPDKEHPWVHTPPKRFEEYMQYLHNNKYIVIALRDLAEYVDPDEMPDRPLKIIQERQKALE